MIDVSPSPSFWLACGVAFLLWAGLMLLEKRQRGGDRLLLRGFLLFLALFSLFLVWHKPARTVAGAATTILLNGNAPAQLDSLLEHYPAAEVYSLQPHARYPQLQGLSYLPQHLAPGNQLLLLGEGLTKEEASFLTEYVVQYVPGSPVAGVLRLSYLDQLSLGDSLRLEGAWRPSAAGERLLLTQGALALDSAQAAGAGVQGFRFHKPLNLSGKQLFRLYWLGERGDTLGSYPMPVTVMAPQPLQIALLTAYPEPESKYLKEYLRQQGHRLYYAAELAPGKQLEEWINLPRESLLFSAEGLSKFDLVIASSSYWSGLSRSKQQLLQQQMHRKGLGLLVYSDAQDNTLPWGGEQLRFASTPSQDSLALEGQALGIEYRPIELLPEAWSVLEQGRRGPFLVGKRVGLGRVVVSGGQGSYRLLLKGKEVAYAAYWKELIGEALPMAEKTSFFELVQSASERYPVRLRLYSGDSLPQIRLYHEQQQLIQPALWQSAGHASQWEILFWPQKAGWYTAITAGDTLQLKIDQVPSSLQRQRLRDQVEQLSAATPSFGAERQNFRKEPIPKLWFYVLFLASMGGLWLERKLWG